MVRRQQTRCLNVIQYRSMPHQGIYVDQKTVKWISVLVGLNNIAREV